jgi:hypothetical protein
MSLRKGVKLAFGVQPPGATGLAGGQQAVRAHHLLRDLVAHQQVFTEIVEMVHIVARQAVGQVGGQFGTQFAGKDLVAQALGGTHLVQMAGPAHTQCRAGGAATLGNRGGRQRAAAQCAHVGNADAVHAASTPCGEFV